jgi:acyl-CoA thioester hydrolase
MSGKVQPDKRGDYLHFRVITTRWMDNDVYGHVNNVVYYSYFDTVVGQYLVESGALNLETSGQIGYVVETQCRFFSPLSFPSIITAGLRVGHIGTSSVRYEIGIFRDDEMTASAQGHFVHVYVDRRSAKPLPLSPALRQAVSRLQVLA